MSLTGTPLVVLLGLLTAGLPAFVVLTWRRRPRGVLGVLTRFAGIVVCQGVAIGLVGVLANNSFGFYNSWSDVLGGKGQVQQAAAANGLVPGNGSQGSVVSLSIAQGGHLAAGQPRRLTALAWLPPGYDRPPLRTQRLPVVMMLPGQPGTPEGVFRQFAFGRTAAAAITAGTVKPFVAVFPPLMVDPPRDTECTDVPNGPQAETWLWKDVRTAVLKRLRVSADPHQWSTMGWSTGGFCAAKLLLRHRDLFGAAAGLGAYYDSETDHTTGQLFGNSQELKNENSPLWLIQHPAGQPTNLLVVVSRQDTESYGGAYYADSRTMIAKTAGVPGVSTILLPSGGHNYRVYAATLPQVFAWLGKTAGL